MSANRSALLAHLTLFSQGWAAVALFLLGIPGTAWGIPILTPHTHSNPGTVDHDTTWLENIDERPRDPDPDNPEFDPHQHRDEHPLDGQRKRRVGPDDRSDATNPRVISLAGPERIPLGFSTKGVWDNGKYSFGGFEDQRGRGYAHGFIEFGEDVLYRFVDGEAPGYRYRLDDPLKLPGPEGKWNTDNDARAMRVVIERAFETWERAVNGQSRNINGVLIDTRIGFTRTTSDSAQIYIHLGLPGDPLGTWSDDFQYLSFKFPNPWDTDPVDGIDRDKFDFQHVALHEIGHALGLAHFGINPSWNLMDMKSVDQGGLPPGTKAAGIDEGSLHGVTDLYSIPCPQAQPGDGGALRGQAVLDAPAGCPLDYGDAPNSYKTLLLSDGPRYEEGTLQRLGGAWDAEPDGQPTLLADGDDRSLLGGSPDPLDDEDGVIFHARSVDVILDILRPGLNPYLLRAWWDVNRNGCFDHTTAYRNTPDNDRCNLVSELLINDSLVLEPGVYMRHYELGFDPLSVYSRFRLTWDPVQPDVWPYGEFVSVADGFSHGEVEDYVPEPSSLVLFAIGAGALFAALRRVRYVRRYPSVRA